MTLVHTTLALFERAFGGAPAAIASAPGRVNLIGEHTDYNGGEVLPIGVQHRTVVAVRPSTGAVCRAVSDNQPNAGEFAIGAPARSGEWWDYIAGVAAELGQRMRLPAFDVAVASDVPPAAGLSSSAALEVAAATALASMAGAPVAPREAALAAHAAEVGFVGVSCGIMDQFASALARPEHALHIECDTQHTDQVPMADAVLIFDTAVPRSLRTSAYSERRAECDRALALLREIQPGLRTLADASPELLADARLPEPLDRRARHVVTETARVREAVAALARTGSIPGELLLASHASLRDDYECSSPELDWFVNRVMQCPGVRGARLTGAGWGGCAIAIGEPEALVRAAHEVSAEYEQWFELRPRTWISHAGAGTRVESPRQP